MRNLISKILNWIKTNKLSAFLLAVILYFFLRGLTPTLLGSVQVSRNMDMAYDTGGGFGGINAPLAKTSSYMPQPAYEAAPQPNITDRMVITDSNMSLQVENVKETVEKIKARVKQLSGYVVSSNVSGYEYGDSGYITIRVPSDSLDATLEYFRGLAVKIVSENVSGRDITDQYIDIQERIDRLEETKARFETFMVEANTIEQILKVQREILNLQNEIDMYVGQQQYMDGASKTTLISISLSTDELSLPYVPEHTWRPDVVFKQAYRSLLMNLIKVGNLGIWVVVYTPLILLAWLSFIIIKRAFRKKQ